MVKLKIDEKEVSAEPGTTILQAAELAGIKIPTLCYHKALTPWGGCRLCVVEVAGNPRLVASCAYPVEEGIQVKTNSERVVKARKLVVELLYLRSPNVPKVKELVREFGVDEEKLKRFWNDDEKCILCGLCVRVCKEKMNVNAIDFVNRGYKKEVTTPYGNYSPICRTCGACAFVCPTGAIELEKITDVKPVKISDEFNLGLTGKGAISILYPQVVPNIPAIDSKNCIRLLTGDCGICKEICKAGAIDYEDKEKIRDLEVGAVILSPGYEIFNASLSGEYGYGRYPNVITSLEFERILSASGPFGGKILRPYDKTVPKKIAFVQCVGSRDIERPWCSSICCMYATKEAMCAKEHTHDLNCKIFYRDLRAFGKGYESYYERAKSEGIEYICETPSTVKQDPITKNLRIQYRANGEVMNEDFDLVVLCIGISPRPLKEMSEKLNLKLNEFGFIDVDRFFRTNLDGVFAAGVSTGPKDIPESVMESSAAASECLALLHDVKGTLIKRMEYPPERDVKKEEPRVGIFVCHCGTNIAGVVNVPEVVEYAKTLSNVVHAENNLYTCSADTCKRIKDIINEKKLNRVVVASCTPRTHEPLFMDTLREAGLNPYLFEMANIRDQCSWVHMREPERATKKAKDLVRMAVTKVKMNESLYPQYLKVNKSALIIGGGIAGMTSALQIAKQGYDVHLVEKSGELGGYAVKIKHILEGDIKDILKKTVEEVRNNKKIKVYLNSEILSVDGIVGNFKTSIKVDGTQKTIEHGVIIIATGAKEHRPQEYLYGEKENVLTQLDLEEKLFNGGLNAKNFVMLQCVGSREAPRNYCSRVCCLEAVKNGLKIKELYPSSEVYVIHRDIRTYGFYEKFYRNAREKGIKFIRYDGEKPVVKIENGGIKVSVKDRLLNFKIDLDADVLVLSSAVEANELNKDLSQKLKVPLTQDGFFLESHMKLRPVDFATDGMYVCGTAHGPKTLFESIAQSMAAATRASTILSKDELEIEPRISEVIEENCDGCAYCIDPCSYKAVTLIEYMKEDAIKKTVEVDISKCRGCGVCMATCPKKGIYVRNFRQEQLSAVIEAALSVG